MVLFGPLGGFLRPEQGSAPHVQCSIGVHLDLTVLLGVELADRCCSQLLRCLTQLLGAHEPTL